MSNQDVVSKLFDVCKFSLEHLLEENPVEGKEVTRIVINQDGISLYTGKELNIENRIVSMAEGTNIVPIDLISSYVTNYPRIILKTKKLDKPIRIDNTDRMLEEERSYVLGVISTSNLMETKNPHDVLGMNIYIEKEIIYVDEGPTAKRDGRSDLYKYAKYQSASIFDFAVFQLQVNGYKEGMYRMADTTVYGYNEAMNQYVRLDSLPKEVQTGEYLKRLDFRNLSFHTKKWEDSATNHFIQCPLINPIRINVDLKKSLNQKTGIVILDSLLAVDLLNSDFIDEETIKSIWYSGASLAKRNPNLITTVSDSTEDKKDSVVRKLGSLAYNMILDDNDYLSVEDIITLSQTSLVVIGKKIKDIRVFCNIIGAGGVELYNRFIDNIIYMGSIYSNTGLEIGDTSKRLLKAKDFYSFGEVLEDNKIVYNILDSLNKKDIKQISFRGGFAIVTTSDDEEKRVNTKVMITEKHIINFLWKITNPTEQKTMIDLLHKEGNYTTIYQQRDSKGNPVLIKINVFKTGTGLNMRAYRIDIPTDLQPKEDEDGTIKIYLGGRGTGKTYHLKKSAYTNSRGKRVLILDKDFDFDPREFKSAKEIVIVRDSESLMVSLIKNFNPDIMIINTPIEGNHLFQCIENMGLRSKIYLATTYNIILEMKEYHKDSPAKLDLVKDIEKRVKIINKSNGDRYE